MVVASESQCRLCSSSYFAVIDMERHHDRTFRIARCRDCGLVYVRETYDMVSPDYVRLESSDIDASLIWLQGQHKYPAYRQFLRALDRLRFPKINKGAKLLDVGCGTGGFLAFVRDRFECYGFDASEAQAQYAKKTCPNVRKATSVREYLGTLGCPSMTFDIITLWDVLEHIRRPREFMAELSSALADDGLMYISVPNANPMLLKSNINKLVGFPGFGWAPHEHVAYYTPATLRTLLEGAGLRVIEIGSTAVYPRPLSGFEALRRIVFFLTRFTPTWAPQIYTFARVSG